MPLLYVPDSNQSRQVVSKIPACYGTLKGSPRTNQGTVYTHQSSRDYYTGNNLPVGGSFQNEKLTESVMKDAMETISKLQSLNPENENEFRQFQRNKMPVDRGTGMFYDLQSSLESEENFIEDDESLDKHADLRSYVQKGFYPKLEPPFDDHELVPIGTNKPCAYCEFQKRRTKSGWYVYSRFRCNKCGVALCKGKRGCFIRYHQGVRQYSNIIE
jgi:hypothetical protein